MPVQIVTKKVVLNHGDLGTKYLTKKTTSVNGANINSLLKETRAPIVAKVTE